MAGKSSAAQVAEKGTREPVERQNARTSRASQSRENAADPRARPKITAGRPLNLPYVKARPGMVQRYGRMSYDGRADDASNVSKLEGEGWVARKADTLPPGITAPTIRKGEWAGYIGNRGMILMERPKSLNDEYKAASREAADAQVDHVKRQLFNEHRPGVKGLGRPKMTAESSVGVRGRRRAQVQDDDVDTEVGDEADDD